MTRLPANCHGDFSVIASIELFHENIAVWMINTWVGRCSCCNLRNCWTWVCWCRNCCRTLHLNNRTASKSAYFKKRIKLRWWGYDVQMWIEIHVHATKNGESVKFIYRLMVTWADGIHITFVSVTALSVCYLSPFLPNDKNGLICLLVNVTFLNE